jgi:ABC-type multidrug transport system fused ATPase/permease subunit
MENGRISSMGTYEDLDASGSLDWVKNMEEEFDDDVSVQDSDSDHNRSRLNSTASDSNNANRNVRSRSDVSNSGSDDKDDKDKELVAVKDGITVAEDKAIGMVNSSIYLEYFKTIGLWKSLFGLLLMILTQFLAVSCNIILANWSRMDKVDQNDMDNIMYYLYFVVATIIVSFFRSVILFKYTTQASQLLHNEMLRSVIRAPVLFFDSNPIGRLINRFAKDVATADDQLPMAIYDFFQCFLMVIAAILVVASGLPYIFIALIPMTYYFISLRNKYLLTSREVKRIESISRSPIFTHLTESLDGVVTLRSYKRRDAFLDVSKKLIDTNMRAYFAFQSCSRWLGFRLDAMVVVLLFISTFGAVYCKNISAIEPSLLAVGIMYVIQCSGLFQWCVRLSAELENMMISVERIISFTNVKSEPELHCIDGVFPEKWPENGGIELKNLVCTYRVDLPPVIIDVSVTIKAGERVGIVGRTGSGKSTLIGALLRLVDITSGGITLDGIDITKVGLHDLRPKISVIPQGNYIIYYIIIIIIIIIINYIFYLHY